MCVFLGVWELRSGGTHWVNGKSITQREFANIVHQVRTLAGLLTA
jgi:hypothetical protein